MRIAVYENLPPGGALRTSFEIGRELIARGHEINLFRLSTYVDKGSFDLAPQAHAVEVIPYRPVAGALDARLRTGHLAPRSYTLFGPLKRLHRRLAARIINSGYDVVLLQPDAMTDAPYVLRWLDGIPTVYYCQEPLRFASEIAAFESHRQNLASSPGALGPLRVMEDALVLGRLARADQETARHARVIVVNSVYSRERVWAAYARHAEVCYLGIDPGRFVPNGSSAPRRREVLSLGAPVEAKGHELVIRALAALPAETRPTLRVVLPRAIDTTKLQQASRDHHVELVIESGLAESEVVERYQRALMTVCAGRLEPFGLTSLESLACATPVVALREAGYRESIIDGVTGLLVEPETPAMTAAIAQLANDPALAASMGAAGRNDVLERWTWARAGRQMEEILLSAAHRD